MSRSPRWLLCTAGNRQFVGTLTDLTAEQEEKEQTEYEIETREADQREDGGAAAHHLAVAVARVKETMDQPWLTSEFGSHPAQRIGDVRIRECQHQHPEQPRAGFQSAAPHLEACTGHEEDEERAQRDHEMKRVVQELDVVGPCLLGIFLQPVDIALERAVGEKTKPAGYLNRIVEPPRRHVGLSNDGDTRQGSTYELPFHCGQRYRLVLSDQLCLLIAG